MRLAALFSGGKDSTYAAYIAQQMGWEVAHLVSIWPQEDSMMFHVPNIRWTRLGSEAMGIPLVTAQAGEGEAAELEALARALGGLNVDGVVTGAIASDYQWSRINGVCHDLGLRTFSPLWRKDQAMLVTDMLAAGYRAIFVSASAEGLDESWLGRPLDAAALRELVLLHERRGLNISGEGGEYETMVLDGPNFSRAIEVVEATRRWRGSSGVYSITKAHLVAKHGHGGVGSGAARI